MYKVKNTLPTIHLYLLFIFLGAFLFAGNVSATAITNIAIDPTLDISYFDSYTLSASISAEPTSASITLNGMNKAGGSDWIYYADGAVQSSPLTYSMSNLYGTTWAKTFIRPDNIYPTILFAPASLTWSTTPLDTIIRRNNY